MIKKNHNYFVKTTSFMLSLVLFLTCFWTIPVWAIMSPTITTQPVSQTVTVGQPASFSVTATGTAPLSYQWQRNGSNISGETSATLIIPNVQGTNTGSYTVVVRDSADNSVTSNAATLTAIDITSLGFSSPNGVAVDSSGKIYVVDSGNNAIKRMDADGTNIVTLGSGFSQPARVTVDSSGKIYVADTGHNTIKRMDADGTNIVTLGSGFSSPAGVAVDSSGKIYVADHGNSAIKRMDADGTNIVTLGSGFSSPAGVAVDSSGKIYVADTGHNAIKRMDADGTNIVTLGSGFFMPQCVVADSSGKIYVADMLNNAIKRMDADGTNIVTLGSGFSYPAGVAVDSSGKIYVVDTGNSAIKRMDADGTNIVTLGSGFSSPNGVAVDSSGKIYVADSGHHAIKRMDADGTNIVTLGSGFSSPDGVAVDSSGKIYVADSGNNAIKRMDADGTNIVTLGLGFIFPAGVAVDSSGKIYVADSVNNAIKRMDADGTNIVTLGSGFSSPDGVAVDSSGKICVADSGNNAIKRMDADGTNIVTLGSGFSNPAGVAVDSSGKIYVGDYGHSAIKRMDADGTNIVTLGSGFLNPNGVAVDSSGKIYVADLGNNSIKKIQTIYGVTYDGNGSDGGSVPTDVTNYVYGQSVIVLGNTGNLVKTGSTFAGWNTATTGSAISYQPGDTFPMGTDNVTLYAQWNAIKTLVSITTPSAITGVANGTAKTASALGLPATVTLVTDNGNVQANVNWDVSSSSYDPSNTGAQTFTVDGAVTLPSGVVNPNSVALTTSISVTVNGGSGGGGGGGSSSGGGSASSGGTTVTGSVIDGTTGANISNLTAAVTTDSNGNYAVAMKADQTVTFQEPDGTRSSLSDLTKVSYVSASGTSVTVSADGTINFASLAKRTDNQYQISYDLGNGQTITLGTLDIAVSSDGTVSVKCTLIDPYGIITDAATGKPIAGVKVTLYYANTERNKSNGKTPDTLVTLPGIDGFKPNNNQNPQTSNAKGAYGFMVFPNTDYYIVAVKEGYEQYTSPTISVGQDIVHWDFKMSTPITGVNRMAGQSQVDTALAIAKANYSGTLSSVVFATADNYPDALAGSVLAYKLNAPILLVGSSEADQAKVLDYMKSNLAPSGNVYILGGIAVVSAEMEAKIKADGFNQITRLGGTDRYETCVKIADQLQVKSGTPLVLAYGENYPDALSVSSIAAEMQYPILLVQKDGLSDAVKNEIAAIKPTKVYIIGGEGVISSTVESQVAQINSLDKANIVRIAGVDRYDTSLAVAKYFNLSGQSVCIATGNNFPDALAGSVYASNHNAPIILADGSLSDQVMNYLKGKKLTGTVIFGGEAVVSKDIEQQLGQLMGN